MFTNEKKIIRVRPEYRGAVEAVHASSLERIINIDFQKWFVKYSLIYPSIVHLNSVWTHFK